MEVFHTTLAEMTEDLTEAERERSKWLRVGDVVLDNLQKEIQMTSVSYQLFSHECVLLGMKKKTTT